jgi:hypothetical protein
MSSLASHVASFLPPHEPLFFLSFFHNPDYSSPAIALRAALTSISESQTEVVDTTIMYNLLDIVSSDPRYDALNPERKSFLMSDTWLSMSAASGRGDDALDIIWLLYELQDDGEGNLEMGMYHNTPSPTALPVSSVSSSTIQSPKLFVPVPDRSRSESPPPSSPNKKPHAFQWQSVPIRKPSQTYPHSAYIPSANPSNARRAFGGNALGKGGKGDVGELPQQQRPWKRESDELLRQAARAWKERNKKGRGGEVAAYYAERAREVQEVMRREQLENARLVVEAKRYFLFFPRRSISSLNLVCRTSDTVDLHGTTITEATIIVKEILQQDGCSPSP